METIGVIAAIVAAIAASLTLALALWWRRPSNRSEDVLGLDDPHWWRKQIRHEHVFTRKSLVEEMLARPEKVEEILREKAIACVVTKDEHVRLTRFDKTHSGWDRYRAAGISVFDVATDPPTQLR